MKKASKFLMLFLIITVCCTISSCKNGSGNQDDKPGAVLPSQDFIYKKGSDIKIVYSDGDSLGEKLALELHVTMLGYTYSNVYVVTDADEDPGEHEIVIGKTNRDISADAYRRLERMDFDPEEQTRYLTYSDGKSVAIAYDEDIYDINSSAITAAGRFADDYIKSGETLILNSGVVYKDITNPIEYQIALDDKEREKDWVKIAEEIKELENADEIMKELKDYYTGMFNYRVVSWLADLYDTETGAFYYSNSGRNTEGYGPDIESTQQAFAFLNGSGITDCIGGVYKLPESMKEPLGKWVKSLQDPNGFFYHPQWTKAFVDSRLSRRGRDQQYALVLLNIAGYTPTYSFNDVEGDYTLIDGTRVDPLGNPVVSPTSLTGRLMDYSASSAVSVLVPTASEAPSHLRSESAFRTYLGTLNIREDSYSVGNTLAAQSPQIKSQDKKLGGTLIPILEKWLKDNQNPIDGTWNWSSEKRIFEGNNGVLKIVDLYNDLEMEFPRPELAIATAVDLITNNYETLHVCDTYNVWYAIDDIFKNLRTFAKDEAATEAKIAEIRSDILANAPLLIKNTMDNLFEHRKQDGSFSYYKHETSAESQGVQVALGHTDEGDINSTYICMVGTTNHMFNVLGLTAPGMFGKTEYCIFSSIINGLGEIIKDPTPKPEVITFDNDIHEGESSLVDTSACKSTGQFMVINDPRDPKGKVFLIDAKNDGGDSIKMTPTSNVAVPNSFIFEADMMVEDANGGKTVAQIRMDQAYMLTLHVSDGKLYINDASSTNATLSVNQTLGIELPLGKWFKIRVQYFIGTEDTVRTVISINGTPLVISDNYYDGKGEKLMNGSGSPNTDYTFWEFIGFSYTNVKLMLDNVLVCKSKEEYSKDNYDHSKLLFDADPPVLDEVVYDFEDGVLPEDFGIISGAESISSADKKLSIKVPAASSLEFTIPENKRTPKATATIFEALMNFANADSGSRIELALVDDNENPIVNYRLSVVLWNGQKYVTLSEAPDGVDGKTFDLVKVPASASFKLGFEYYPSEKSVIIMLNDVPVDITGNLAPDASKYISSKLKVTNIGNSAVSFSFDDIKLESNTLDFEEKIQPENDSIIYDFEDGIPDEITVFANTGIADTSLGKALALKSKNSGFTLPINNRGFAMKTLTLDFEATLVKRNGESITVTILGNDSLPMFEYIFMIEDGALWVYESTSSGTEKSIVSADVDGSFKITVDYFINEGRLHVYVNEKAIFVSSGAYASGRELIRASLLSVKYSQGTYGAEIDNVMFECGNKAYKKLVIQTLQMGTGVYYTQNKDKSLDFDNLTSFASDLNGTKILRVKTYPGADGETVLNSSRVYISTEGDGNKLLGMHTDYTKGASTGQQPAIIFNLMHKEEGRTTYVFESDVMFGSVSKGMSNIGHGRKAFGFVMGSQYDVNSVIDSSAFDGLDSDYASSIKMLTDDGTNNGNLVKYRLFNVAGKGDINPDTWVNIRITFNTATGEYKAYLNGELLLTKTYSGVTEITGFTVFANKYIGGNLSVKFDNTYFGTYDDGNESSDPKPPTEPEKPTEPQLPTEPEKPTEPDEPENTDTPTVPRLPDTDKTFDGIGNDTADGDGWV